MLLALGAPAEVLDGVSLLRDQGATVGRVLMPDEPGGSPEGLPLTLPLLPPDARLARVGLKFTTAQGQEVAAAVPTSIARAWRPLVPGAAVPVRYDPDRPAEHPAVVAAWEVWLDIVLHVLALWIALPAMIRAARGATDTSWRTALPPWPFRR